MKFDALAKLDLERRRAAFVRRKEQRGFCDLGHLTKELLSSGASQNLETMILAVPPGGSSGRQPSSSQSEKAGLVLEGEFVLQVGDARAKLSQGDSFTFDGLAPHSFHNPGRGTAKVLWVISNAPMHRHI